MRPMSRDVPTCDTCYRPYLKTGRNQKRCGDCHGKRKPKLCGHCGATILRGRCKPCADRMRYGLLCPVVALVCGVVAPGDRPQCRLCRQPFERASSRQAYCRECQALRSRPAPPVPCSRCGVPKGLRQPCVPCAEARRETLQAMRVMELPPEDDDDRDEPAPSAEAELEIPCATCLYAVPEPRAYLGYMCRSRANECIPLGAHKLYKRRGS